MQNVSIRHATTADTRDLDWVAQRDTRSLPPGPHLVAEVDGRILVARSLTTGEVVADPFSRTAGLREMVALRANQLDVGRRRARFAARWAPGYPRLQAR